MGEPVSVIIPTYNRTNLLQKAVDSVLSQTYKDFELIVVDDGSDDHTAELIAGYAGELVFVQQENRGPAAARNCGIRRARYDLIAFLDSDDWFDRQKLAMQVEAMHANPSSLVSHTQEIWFRNGTLLNQKKKHQKRDGDIFGQCLKLCAVSMSTVMLRRALLDAIGLFDEELRCCEDYDFWLRASIDHRFLLIDKPLTFKDGGRPDQVSHRYRVGMDRFRIKSILGVLESGCLSPAQAALARKELVKKCSLYGNGCTKHGKPDEGRYYHELAERYAETDKPRSGDNKP